MSAFRPMRAAELSIDEIEQLKFPILASVKYDGIRCVTPGGEILTKKLKRIPNNYIRFRLGFLGINGTDGELTAGKNFQDCTSAIMAEDGEPAFTYHIFDMVSEPEQPFFARITRAALLFAGDADFIKIVLPEPIHNPGQLRAYYQKQIDAGEEGIMVRDSDAGYKHGQATVRGGQLIKIKPFKDSEAVVIGFTELMKNNNPAETNALGLTERSSAKENKTGKNSLGALIVRHPEFGIFKIGTGFPAALRAEIYANQDAFLGKLAKFRYQALGTKDRPRIASFIGFRHELDL